MSLNMKSLLAKTATLIEKTVQTTVSEVTGPKALQDYILLHQIGSAGPAFVWKIYSAKANPNGTVLHHQYPTVSVWVLDKKALSDARVRAGFSRSVEDAFLDIIRADCTRLVRMRHPGVVHVVHGLDEGKNVMAMVTEPLFASVANAVGDLQNVAHVPKELNGMEMGLLEVKHGLLQLAESLNFLHNNARLVHRGLAPESVLITVSGAWKLGGFGFSIHLDQGSGPSANMQTFHYSEYDVEDSLLPLQPSLNYTAPELVQRNASSNGWSSDIFSFGCLAYRLIARKPLFNCHNNVKMYMNNLNYLSSEAFSSIPPDLVLDLQKMLSSSEANRPSAMDFTGSPFFRSDTRLRALRFLDHLLERDNLQKSEFLKALSEMWKDFDSRVLRYKVLPPLCAELRNSVMQPMIVPMVLTIAESQDKTDFELSTLPALVPVLTTAKGETLLLLLKHADLIISKASRENLVSHVLPFFIRAYDDTDPRMQEESLKRTVSLAKHLNVQLVREAIAPRVHIMALRTTVAAVRVKALLSLADMVHMLDKPSVLTILQTIQRCTAVDRSALTLMCTLGVANSIMKQHGPEFVAEHVLPLITPLLIVQQLNVQQFAKYMLFVKDTLRKLEEQRGVTVADNRSPEVKQSPSLDVRPAVTVFNVAPATTTTKNNPSWDEDWVTTSKLPANTNPPPSIQPSIVNQQKQAISPPSGYPMSSQQNGSSCPPDDIEWPPRSYSVASSQSGHVAMQNPSTAKSSPSLDETDPFTDWPPGPTVAMSASRSSMNGRVPSTNISSDSWTFQTAQNRGTSVISSGNNFIGSSNNQNSMMETKKIPGNSIAGASRGTESTNLGSTFLSGKNEVTSRRLAPPPSTALGRGRGQGKLRATLRKPGQPPIMDLL